MFYTVAMTTGNMAAPTQLTRRPTVYHEVEAKTILNRVRGMSFTWSVSPYRGCAHACVYCFARATHAFLGLDAGDDFEYEIFVKTNAPALLRQELQRPAMRGEPLVFGTVSDPYQPAEARYRLTRGLLQVAGEAGNPVIVTTKSSLITQDLPLLAMLAGSPGCAVNITITTLDATIARQLEPRTPHPQMRLETIARLANAGIPVGILLAPVLPGITDRPGEIEQLAAAVAARGATYLIADPLCIDDGFAAPLLAAIARDFPAKRPIYERQAATGHPAAGTAAQLAARVDAARRRFGLAGQVPDLRRPRPEQLGLPLAG